MGESTAATGGHPMTEPTTDPVEAVARAMREGSGIGAPGDWSTVPQYICDQWIEYARLAMEALTALGAVMPDDAAKLRADLAAARAEAVRYRSGELQALARLGEERDDVLALCRPTRGDALAGSATGTGCGRSRHGSRGRCPMPSEKPVSPELAAAMARVGHLVVRRTHTRPAGSTGWMSTACAFRLDSCQETDCCCTCHEPREFPSGPITEGGDRG